MTTPKKQAVCRVCNTNFEYDWHALAKHISTSKKGHRAGKKWAAKYLLQVNRLNAKRDLPQRVALTEEQKESRRELKRETSGETESVKTYCPMCKHGGQAILEAEYTQSGIAWKRNDRFVIMCNPCRG